MTRIADDIRNTLAYYKSKATLVEKSDLPEGTHVYVSSRFVFYIPDPYFFQPPVDVERKKHFSNVARLYALPEGVNAQDMQAYAMFTFSEYRGETDRGKSVAVEKLERLYDALLDKNPSLEKIPLGEDPFDSKYHIIMGVASAFRVDDIRHFVTGNTGVVSVRNPAWKVLNDRLKAKGIRMQ